MKKKIILASASPRRKELLLKIVPSFLVVPSSVDESQIKAKTPEMFVKKAAEAKALDVASKHKDSIVIGADTVVVLGCKILGKPKDKLDAIQMLKSLTGKTQKVITGIGIVDSNTKKKKSFYVVTKVKMKKVSDKEVLGYIEAFKPLDKAGAYGIQELDEVFIDRVDGDFDNVVGFPVSRILKELNKFNAINIRN